MGSHFLRSNRRDFLKTGLSIGAAALLTASSAHAAGFDAIARTPAAPQPPVAPDALPSRVALTNGDGRTDNIFRALRSLEKEIAQSIGNRRVVIKPNNVSPFNQLASTHADALIGILEFLKSIGKLDNAIIAESSAMGSAMQGYESFGYMKVAEKYNVKLVDLDQDEYLTIMGFDQSDAMPHPVRVSKMLTNQRDNFIISACMLKAHDRAVATMSIKNIIFGAPLKLPNPGSRRLANDKVILHGGGAHGICINMAMLAPLLHPSLSVIDGFEGMEGNGPISGTRVDHRVCVVSTDYLAADSVGASLMGINPMDVGYLAYLTKTNVGQSDLSKMEILGEPVETLAKKYKLGVSIEKQLEWKNPAKVTATT